MSGGGKTRRRRKRGAPDKAAAQRRHAAIRAADRYGGGMVTVKRARHVIQAGRAAIVERQSNRVVVYDVTLDQQVHRVVYDRKRREVVTFLPRP